MLPMRTLLFDLTAQIFSRRILFTVLCFDIFTDHQGLLLLLEIGSHTINERVLQLMWPTSGCLPRLQLFFLMRNGTYTQAHFESAMIGFLNMCFKII